mmetsp:Transcript_42329/g.114213  ORF Transcript_42329/g.114213 Transcript_42329/m.114213 type:complete len:244 (+) Transcript_42329:167-898(+)
MAQCAPTAVSLGAWGEAASRGHLQPAAGLPCRLVARPSWFAPARGTRGDRQRGLGEGARVSGGALWLCGGRRYSDQAGPRHGHARGEPLCAGARLRVGAAAERRSAPRARRRGRVGGLRERGRGPCGARRAPQVGGRRRGGALLCQYVGEGRPRRMRQPRDLLPPSLGPLQASGACAGHEHRDVGAPHDRAASADVGVLGLPDLAARQQALGVRRRRPRGAATRGGRRGSRATGRPGLRGQER